jgi:hypothetical protein
MPRTTSESTLAAIKILRPLHPVRIRCQSPRSRPGFLVLDGVKSVVMLRLARALTVGIVICLMLLGQTRPSLIQKSFENGDFSRNKPGEFPTAWHLGREGTPDYSAEVATGQACTSGMQCAIVRSLGIAARTFCFLYQVYDAQPFRGEKVKFRAAVRVTGNGYARILVRIHRVDGSTSFRDDMGDHPITSANWAFYEIEAPVSLDARDIELGMQDFEQGIASIDRISVTYSK